MKKIILAALAALTIVFGFTACSSSDNGGSGSSAPKVKVAMESQMNSTILALCNMTVSYEITVADGKTESNTITANNGFSIDKLECPCNMTFKYSFVPKAATFDETQSYILEYGPKFIAESSSNNSYVMRDRKCNITIKGDKLKDYLEQLANKKYEITIIANKRGEFTVME